MEGKPNVVGSNPALGDGCASSMRVKLSRRSMTFVLLKVNTSSKLDPMLDRVNHDPVERLLK